ncbi:Stage II sporulation protein Q [Bacteroidales bacterium Barb6XT]|nr:Stage II sporulation protein Q [Bacteroidales bacterium Barb6XT]
MRYCRIALFMLCSVLTVAAQKSSDVSRLEKQRKEALAEIETTNSLLKETVQTAQNSLNRLNLLTRQIVSRKQVINLTNQEITAIDAQISELDKELTGLRKELATKQTNYNKSLQAMRRQSPYDKLLFVLSAESFTQSVRRMRYLREYAFWQKRQAIDIAAQQKEVEDKQEQLRQTRSEKQSLLTQREEENKKLLGEESNQKQEVQQINRKKTALQTDLKKKQQQAQALNQQIEKLIAEEIAAAEAARKKQAAEAEAARKKQLAEAEAIRKKQAAEAEDARKKQLAEAEAIRKKQAVEATAKATTEKQSYVAASATKPAVTPPAAPPPATPPAEERTAATKGGYAMTKAEKQLSDDFAGNRGRLPFPIEGRYTIIRTFGEQQHQELKYIRTNNSGIDLQTVRGTDARAVFKGEVTRVFVIPGYNNSVIIRHGNYLTVYSNLSQVYVKAGDKVSTRQAIGKIFSDADNGNETILHFQIRKEKDKLNPMLWLDK